MDPSDNSVHSSRGCHDVLGNWFGALGGKIATYPKVTIGLCCCFVVLCSVGFARMKFEDRTKKLFIPQHSKSIKDLEQASKYFPTLNTRDETIIFLPKSGGNVLEKSCLEDVLEVHKAVTSLPLYSTYCVKRRDATKTGTKHCVLINPMEIFNFDMKNVVNIKRQLSNAYNNPNETLQNNRPVYLNFPHMFGNIRWNLSSGLLQSADVIQVSYFMREPSDEKELEKVMEWEKVFINKMSSLRDKMTCMKIYYTAERSLNDAVVESTGSDILLVCITFTLMISFSCTMLGKFCNPLTGHSLLANAGIFAVALGIVAGFGLSMLVGVPFVSVVGIVPFLILGIGIDDMFIIVDEMDRQDSHLSPVETMKSVMSHSGATVTMTTVTDVVAFAVSTSTAFPSVRYFCIYAALSVTFSYLMIVTFFVAFATFDVRRIKAGRRDCLPVCFAPSPKEGERAWNEPGLQTSSKVMKIWARILMIPPVRVLVIFVSLGLVGAGVYGTFNITESFDRRLLAKDGSYFKEFITMQEKHFEVNIAVSIVLDKKLNYENPDVQDEVMKLSDIATTNKHYTNRTLSWMDVFAKLAQNSRKNITGPNFMRTLKIFLDIPAFMHFREDIVISPDNNSVEASRVICFMKNSWSSIFQRDAMVTLREDLGRASELFSYPISKFFIYFEQYAVIFTETIRNLVIAAVAVLLITWPFLLSIRITLLVFFSFAALVVELFALMAIWNVSLNFISMINLVMAIGFSVDYSAHIAHAFATSPEVTAEGRVEHALSTLGSSVLMGGTSTFIGMVVTAFASSEIFRIFFKMFLGIVLLGLLHGLCFLPVYMSLFCRWKSSRIQAQPAPVAESPYVINSACSNQGFATEDKCISTMEEMHAINGLRTQQISISKTQTA